MMRKQQKLSSGLSDKVRKSKAAPEIQKNPFEVKINRKKFDVLGRKSKHDVGLPGVSRSRANQKRKETLLKEFRLKGKNNKFVDRRFGEYDTKITPEEKILQRFTLERQRTHDRKDMFNLNEEEELTHYGQSLAEMEKMADVIDSDSDSEEKGLLSAELTASHFGGGGGLLRMKSAGDEQHKPKSRQELIEELIIKSKQEKRERQTQKEEAQVLTEKLDQDWRSIQNLLAHKTPKAERKEELDKPKMEEYDVMVRELGFEMKAQPSEKLKSSEEVAREERLRLQTLEADRLKRMMGDAEGESAHTHTHTSADDINDGFILDGDERKTLAYKDGKWNIEEEREEEEDEEGGEEEHETGADDDDDEGEEEEEDEDEDDDDDLQSDEEEGDQAAEEEEGRDEEETVSDEEQRRAVQEAARAELPYTFTAPESYRDLQSLLQGHTSGQQRLILDRTITCHHPSLASGNKAKLQRLFGFLLEYVGELSTQNPPDLRTVNLLIPQICSLCQLFPEAACRAVQMLLSDSAHSMEEMLEVKGRAPMPDLDMLVLLKITALLFPTSDFRHPVTTPAFLYISQALSKCVVVSLEDACKGLILCCLALEFVSLSKRFFPELMNFLLGLLHLTVPDKSNTGYAVLSPFRQQGKNCDLLVLTDPNASQSWKRKPVSLQTAVRCPAEREHCRLSLVDSCLDLVKRCTCLYKDLPSYTHIFQPIRALLLNHLPVSLYPSCTQDLHREILDAIPEQPSQHAPLVFKKKKPIPLKLFTPKIVEILDYGKKRGNTKEEKERERLKHKHKREFKGALREIRKDTRFLAREKLNDIMSRDSERKRKVKELFGSLANQEGEWKALKRKKMK
ncbi:nucleolar protein 14 [Rhinichthys klamathensis goyatoka]|uniref:nucleolar protein 14 n=1 Tax=Rhinichthys klamathensis goyatoka TaxID=3034132 RepID=UPI0024B522A5|nr:nucleolar protein 14 [Rhinichthys klamathensis goyatoka]